MSDEMVPLAADEVVVTTIPGEREVVLAIGADVPRLFQESSPAPVPAHLLDRLLRHSGLGGGALAVRGLTDGSLVRLAPETMRALRTGGTLVKGADGYHLGTVRAGRGGTFLGPAKFAKSANPVAVGLMLQTIALQGQLASVQDALRRIEAQVVTLTRGGRIAIQAELMAISEPIELLVRKARAGYELSPQDETQLRQLSVQSDQVRNQATSWIETVRPLLEEPGKASLEEQRRVLHQAFGTDHIAFWVQAYLGSTILSLAIKELLAQRAVEAADPGWARELVPELKWRASSSLTEVRQLHAGFVHYLRAHDVAHGFEELSIRKKREVRRYRAELRAVSNQLGQSLEALPNPRPALLPGGGEPVLLSRREVEPHPVRDRAHDARVAARSKVLAGSGKALEAAGRRIAGAARASREALDSPPADKER